MKLKDFRNTGEFEIIDNWEKRWKEKLRYDEAIEKYGECIVEASYTEGFCLESTPEKPLFVTAVWVNIPGMHLGYLNSERITIPGGSYNEATFVGKKTGCLITVSRLGNNDYQAWWRDEADWDNENAGYSVRGTMAQIVDEIFPEFYPDAEEKHKNLAPEYSGKGEPSPFMIRFREVRETTVIVEASMLNEAEKLFKWKLQNDHSFKEEINKRLGKGVVRQEITSSCAAPWDFPEFNYDEMRRNIK